MNRIRATIFLSSLMLTAGAFAQYPSGSQSTPQPPQGSMQPSQPQSSQNPGAMQPGQQPGAQPGQPTQAPNAGQVRQAPSIDDQVKMLADQLSLSTDQQSRVKSALENQHTQAMGIIQDNSLAREDKIEKIHVLREGTIAKVRTSLNDDQKKKFDQMIQEQDQRHAREQGQQPPAQPQQPPK